MLHEPPTTGLAVYQQIPTRLSPSVVGLALDSHFKLVCNKHLPLT